MNAHTSKIAELFGKYKYLIIPALPMVFFLTLILILPTQPTEQKESNKTVSTPVTNNPNRSVPVKQNTNSESIEEVEGDSPDKKPGLLQKRPISGGATKYTYTSANLSRPNVTIAKGDHDILFERIVTQPSYPVSINDYTTPYGQPERIIQGPAFYGPQSRTYIYAGEGLAFVANPQTDQVLEQHLFPSMTTDQYIQNFGPESDAVK